jgi:hypothetical protein
VFLKLPMMSVRRVFEAPNDVYDLPRVWYGIFKKRRYAET